jgi:pimeloyl-ACP methyl ester carboxylesterase
MWKVWLKRLALLVVVGFLFFAFGWVPYYLAGVATSRRFIYHDLENDGLTPASFSLPFEDVSLRSSDGVPLAGWWVGAPDAKGTVVMVHGLNRSRIEMVRRVPFVHAEGWNALLIDLRRHGASGGTVTTFGATEKLDVEAAAALARARAPVPVVLWGVSLGAASVMLAAADDPQVAGVVCDSSYLSLDDTLRHHLRLLRRWRPWLRVVPVWPVADEVLFWIGRRGGFDPSLVDVNAAATRLRGRPALFVANSEDVRMPKEIAFELAAAVGGSAQVLVVPGKSHGGAWRDGTAAYEAAVRKLLGRAQQRGAGAEQAAGTGRGRPSGSEGHA